MGFLLVLVPWERDPNGREDVNSAEAKPLKIQMSAWRAEDTFHPVLPAAVRPSCCAGAAGGAGSRGMAGGQKAVRWCWAAAPAPAWPRCTAKVKWGGGGKVTNCTSLSQISPLDALAL